MDTYLIVSAIGWILAPITTYIIARTMVNRNKIIEITYDLLEEISQNVEMQKKFYLIGALIGKGAVDGSGIKQSVGKAKGGFIEQAIGMFIGNMMQPKGKEPEKAGSFFGET